MWNCKLQSSPLFVSACILFVFLTATWCLCILISIWTNPMFPNLKGFPIQFLKEACWYISQIQFQIQFLVVQSWARVNVQLRSNWRNVCNWHLWPGFPCHQQWFTILIQLSNHLLYLYPFPIILGQFTSPIISNDSPSLSNYPITIFIFILFQLSLSNSLVQSSVMIHHPYKSICIMFFNFIQLSL